MFKGSLQLDYWSIPDSKPMALDPQARKLPTGSKWSTFVWYMGRNPALCASAQKYSLCPENTSVAIFFIKNPQERKWCSKTG